MLLVSKDLQKYEENPKMPNAPKDFNYKSTA